MCAIINSGDIMKFKTDKGFSGNLVLQEQVVLTALDTFSPDELKVYLYLSILCQSKKNAEIEDIANKFSISVSQLADIFASLEKKGVIKFSGDSITLKYKDEKPEFIIKPALDPEVVLSTPQSETKEIITAAEKCFGKMLSPKDIDSIMNVKHYYSFPSAVLSAMLGYLEGFERKSVALIEKTAIDWYEKEITSLEKAHEYIRVLEEQRTRYKTLASALGIYGRNLTKKEKEFADNWNNVYTLEQIKEAYEKTIDATGKISFSYMNSILEGKGEKPSGKAPVKRVKPSGFNNFEQKKTDFDEIRRKKRESLMKMMKGISNE